jgi:hypothetical protein
LALQGGSLKGYTRLQVAQGSPFLLLREFVFLLDKFGWVGVV